MEHRPLEQLCNVADVRGGPSLLSRRERLERWSERLALEPERRLRSLGEIEFKPASQRALLRSDNSPLTVAYEDPVLRSAGLESDKLGDAIAFFGLSEGQAHWLLCSCMNGLSMEAGLTARRVARLADPRYKVRVTGVVLGVAFAAPALLYLLV
jgi:hypothetical protein